MYNTYRGTVYPWHCDHMGHMNVQFYAAKFDEATWQLFSILGLTPSYFKEQKRGMVAVDQKTKYMNEILPGDQLAIYSKVIKMKSKSIQFLHIMKNSNTDEILAESEFIGVHIDTIKRKSCEFQKKIYQNAISQITDDLGICSSTLSAAKPCSASPRDFS